MENEASFTRFLPEHIYEHIVENGVFGDLI